MPKYETIAVPFKTVCNIQCLFDEQIVEQPHLKDFIDKFPLCFERDHLLQLWKFYPDGKR